LIGFQWATTSLSIAQSCHPVLAPAFMPSLDGITRHHHYLRHLLRLLPQMEQPDSNGALANFWIR
jgi:hypothetical protein